MRMLSYISLVKNFQLKHLDLYLYFKYKNRMDYSICNLIISSLATAVVGLFSYGTIKMYLLRSRYRHIPGPPTKGILGFYLGNVFEIAKAYQDNKLLNDFILEELFSNLNIIFFNCIN
jgi:hypothetical protein